MLPFASEQSPVFVLPVIAARPACAFAADHQDVIGSQRMTATTGVTCDQHIESGLPCNCHFGAIAAPIVFKSSYSLKVPRIHTATNATKMIQFERVSGFICFWYRAAKQFVRNAMTVIDLRSDAESAVSFKCVAEPEPAAGERARRYEFQKPVEYADGSHCDIPVSFRSGLRRHRKSVAGRLYLKARLAFGSAL